jgi:hypothetical protein
MKILKKYANGGTEPHNSFEMKKAKRGEKRRAKGTFPSGRGGGKGTIPSGRGGGTEPHNSFEKRRRKMTKAEVDRMKKRKGPAGPPARKYMGGGKMKEYGHGGEMKYENGGTNDDRMERRQEMAERRKESRKDRSRNRMRKMATDRRMSARDERMEQMKAKGMNTMEDGGTNLNKKKPSRFERKFSKKRGQYDKDVKKGKTKEAPHERTFKFRPDGQSIFKKRKKYNVENESELRKRKEREERKTRKNTNRESKPAPDSKPDTPSPQPQQDMPDMGKSKEARPLKRKNGRLGRSR